MVIFMRKDRESRLKKKLVLSFSLGVVLIATGLYLMLGEPIQTFTTMYSRVYNGSYTDVYLSSPNEGIHVSCFLFNVTNTVRFIAGQDEALKLQDIGPFTYKEVRTNADFHIDEEAEEMSYTPEIRLSFSEEESLADPKRVNLSLFNIPMLSFISIASNYSWAKLGVNMLTRRLGSRPVVEMNAHEYIWGYSDPLVTLGHTLIPGVINFAKFGFLDRFYDKNMKNHLVLSITDKDKFVIKTRNGHRRMAASEFEDPDQCKTCDTFDNAYEGICFPSGMTPETPLTLFKNGFCRLLPMEFHKRIVWNDYVDALVFNVSDQFFNAKNGSGLLDMSDCFYGFSISASKPHLLDVDSALYPRLQGLNPDPYRHNSYVIIEPKIAVSLDSYFAVQINLVLGDLGYNEEASKFSYMVLPVGYVLITQPPLVDRTIKSLKEIYVIYPILNLILEVVYFISAALLFMNCAFVVRTLLKKSTCVVKKTNVVRLESISERYKEPYSKSNSTDLYES